MKKVMIIALILTVGLFIPAVSAEVLIDEHINYYEFTGGQSINPARGSTNYGNYQFNSLFINEIQNLNVISYIVVESPYMGNTDKRDWCDLPDGRHEMTYNIGEDISGTGTIVVSRSRDFLRQVTNTRVTFYFDTFNIGTLTGNQVLTFSPTLDTIKTYNAAPSYPVGDSPIRINHGTLWQSPYKITVSSGRYILNDIYVESLNEYDIKMKITREFGADAYASNIKIFNDEDIIIYEDASVNDLEEVFLKTDFSKLKVSTSYKSWEFALSQGPTISEGVTVYVRNAQTGALIAGTNLNVNLYETETWYNSTLEWGWDTIQLPPGNYEFYAEKSGFNQYAPGRLTVDGVDDNINLLLYPDVATPPAGNLTLQFWVCDRDLNGIPYAELSVLGLAGEGASFDSGIIQTNNLGYATLTAPGNSTYTAYASKPGYTAGENEFGVTTASPVHITVMLMRGAVPTQPTVSPTITVVPTPTQTSPIQEDNLIGLSVRGLAKGFGIDYDTALLMFGLMIVFGAGGIVMSSVKGGAMEFIAGSIVGTFVAFALGLIPIWIFIIIAVVFGAYVLRVFIQGGQ